MTRQLSTKTRLGSSDYPVMYTIWEFSEEYNGWQGKITFWKSSNEELCSSHTVKISQSTPLGVICVTVDDFGYGCWSMTRLEGVSITERDLQWAAAYASQAIRDKHRSFPCKHSTHEVGSQTGNSE